MSQVDLDLGLFDLDLPLLYLLLINLALADGLGPDWPKPAGPALAGSSADEPIANRSGLTGLDLPLLGLMLDSA